MEFPLAQPRRLAILLWLLVTLCLGACSRPTAPTYESPPIIVVDIDTLRADHLGCYGYGRDTSPEIDRFAEQAARFEWVFSQGPNTPPSQASILTSLYPSTHGRVFDAEKISDQAETLAESAAAAGYRTAAFVDGGLMAKGFGLEQGFELYDDRAGGVKRIGPKVERWLDGHLGDPQTAEQPFLLLVHTYDVHSPYEVTPQPYRNRYLTELIEPPTPLFRRRMSRRMARVRRAHDQRPYPQLPANDVEYAKAFYDGGIRHVDAWFGRFRRFLEGRNLFDQAIVVIISDHGDSFQEHGDLFHGQIYSPVTRIPMIIRLPGGKSAGVYSPVVESIDLMPTLLEAVGIEVPAAAQGQSLLPLMLGRAGAEALDQIAVSESPFYGRRIAVASDSHRLFVTEQGRLEELYAYRADPLEQRDLIADRPEPLGPLRRRLQQWRRQVAATELGTDEQVQEVDAETLEQLVALGYLEPGGELTGGRQGDRQGDRQGPVNLPQAIFADGFESAGLEAWSEREP